MRAAILIAPALIAVLTMSACKDEKLEQENRALKAALSNAKSVLVSEKAKFEKDIEDLEAQRTAMREELDACRTDLAEAVSRGDHEATRALEGRDEVQGLRKENQEAIAHIDALSRAYAELTTAHQQVREEAAAREELVERLQKRLDESEVAAADAVRREDHCESERTRLANRLLDAEERSAGLEKTVAELTERLKRAESPPKSFEKGRGPLSTKQVDAKVTGVNADANVFVLSAGSDDGVEVGDEFTVYRGTEYVAKVVVRKVERDYCVAASKKDVERTPLQVGDSATMKF